MSSKESPKVVDPDEWRSRTYQTISPRGAELRQVDEAYGDWFFNQREPGKQMKLLHALDRYLAKNGKYWDKVSRNKDSGGQMEFIHALMKEMLGFKSHALQTLDIPHSRYGVLYLLGNIDIDVNKVSVFVDSLAKAADVVTEAIDLRQNVLTQAKGTFLGPKYQTDRGLHLGPIDYEIPITAGDVAHGVSALGAFGVNKIDARFGTKQAKLLKTVPDEIQRYHTVEKAVKGALDGVKEMVRRQLNADGLWAADVSGRLLREAVYFAVKKVMKAAMPVVKHGMEAGHHLAQAIRYAGELVATSWKRLSFDINLGHPALIAQYIQWAYLRVAGESTLKAGNAGIKAYLDVQLPGAGYLSSAILSAVEWLVKVVKRFHEVSRIKTFLCEARMAYQEERDLAEIRTITYDNKRDIHNRVIPDRVEVTPNTNPSRGGYIHDRHRFEALFKRGCKASPVIPMLTLNSGICGSLMTMVRMFQDDTRNAPVISEEAFGAGNEYFTVLKGFSRKYLQNSGFGFWSQDEKVRGYLRHAFHDHYNAAGRASKVLAFV